MSTDTSTENSIAQNIPSPFESPIGLTTSQDTKNSLIMSPAELVKQTHEFMNIFSQMAEEKQLPDTIFFLDKSARPVAYLFRKLFKYYCPDQEMPQVRFINIGKSGGTSTSFNDDPKIIADTYGKHINQNGSILVVDEISKTGETLNNAKDFLSKAFPNALVNGVTVYTQEPEWYRDQSKEELLGVEDIPLSKYRKIALELFNEEHKTSYTSTDELPANSEERREYSKIYEKIVNSIPHTQRSHPRNWLIRHFNSLPTILKTRKLFTQGQLTNAQLEHRKELDKICHSTLGILEDEIKQKKKG